MVKNNFPQSISVISLIIGGTAPTTRPWCIKMYHNQPTSQPWFNLNVPWPARIYEICAMKIALTLGGFMGVIL